MENLNISNLSKKVTTVVALVLVAVSFVGCAKNKNTNQVKGAVRAARGSLGSTVQMSATTGVELRGAVTTSSSYQNLFQQAVSGLLNSTLPENYVGDVSATASNNTGVFLGGRVTIQGGIFRPSVPNQQLSIAANSSLLVAVYDSYSLSTASPIPVYLTTATGTISGNYAKLVFYDKYGSITLDGQFDQNTFQGTFSYDNQVKYDGSGLGGAGTLGTFTLPTCQFFVCQ
jgi:hypothetical protein